MKQFMGLACDFLHDFEVVFVPFDLLLSNKILALLKQAANQFFPQKNVSVSHDILR